MCIRSLNFESRTLDVVCKMGRTYALKLNIVLRPIAHKYCEGKMKSILERNLKASEIAQREANGTGSSFRDCCGLKLISGP